MKHPIKNFTLSNLENWLEHHDHPRYRARQIWHWLFEKWVGDFDSMANIPAALREALDESFLPTSVHEKTRLKSTDGTEKYLFTLADGKTVETVWIPSAKRDTVCISTQVGCPVRCAFCASGRGGLIRDLEPGEIIDQVLHICRRLQRRITNVVVMGMGEPLLNSNALIQALDTLCAKDALDLGARRITISTSGIPGGIRKLADHGQQWNLALSLHAASEEGRAKIIPPTYRHPLKEILAALRYYRTTTGRKVTLEYALLAGVNDRRKDAVELAALARDLDAKINLIPCNPTIGRFAGPPPESVATFTNTLRAGGAEVTVRDRRGGDIQAACGQLHHARKRGR